MGTWLLEAEYAVLFFIGACLIGLGPWVSAQYRRFGRVAGWAGLISAATVAYAGSIVAFTMFPLPQVTSDFCTRREIYEYWSLVPGSSFAEVLDYAAANGAIATVTSGVFLQVAFNVLFFVPLGFLLGHRWRAGFWRTALIGLGVSLAIETTQGTGVWGLFPCPYRVAEVDDLITNTTGAVLGWALAQVLNPRLPNPRPEFTPDPGPPGLVRRTVAALIDVLAFIVAVVGIATCVDLARNAIGIGRAGSLETSELAFDGVQIAVIAVLFVVVPARRRFSDWPGANSVACGVVSSETGSPASWNRLMVKAVVRFGPIPFVGLGWLAFGLVDLAVALLRSDQRTLTDILSGTVLATREAMAGEDQADGGASDAVAAGGQAPPE